MPAMELRFLGAAEMVTGSCHMLTINNKKYLLDCGMFQEGVTITRKNYRPFPFEPQQISVVILSHAHIDHSGLIPKLWKEGFRGKVYCTRATKDLCRIMLEDSADVQEREAIYDNKRLKREGKPLRIPLYTKDDARKCMELFRGADYDTPVAVSRGLNVTFRDAGHILGSSIVEIFAEEKKVSRKIVFSGDLGQPNSPIVNDPTFVKNADYVIMESTYGSRVHEDVKNRNKILLDLINSNYQKSGRLLIPVFAVEKAQEMIFRLREFSQKGLLPPMEIFLDSPLARKATEVFARHPECYDQEMKALVDRGETPFEFSRLKYVASLEDSKKLNAYKKPCIIMAGSGMCNGGRIKHHLRNHLGEENSTVLFVGYQSRGTLGRRIREGEKKVKIYGEWHEVRVSVKAIGGFSSHADQPFLVSWARNFKNTPNIYLVHGEPRESTALAAEISAFNRNVQVAKMGQTVRIK